MALLGLLPDLLPARAAGGPILIGMTKIEIQQQALSLPEEERLEVAEAIWASLGDPDALPLPEWQQRLLDERLAASEGDEGTDWEDVKAKLWPQP